MSNTNIKKVRTSDLELKDRLVSIQRVTKVTKGGRTFSFSAIVVVGNEDGVVGYGLGKASEVQSAIAKGVEDAKKNLVKIPVINGTIPHKQESRYSGSLVMIRPAAPGTGIIAGGAMRHRFFLVFQYEPSMRAKRNTVQAIIQRLNEEADTARRYLDLCELEVLEPQYSDNFVLKLLYEILNKKTSQRVRLPEGVFDMTTAVHGIYEE